MLARIVPLLIPGLLAVPALAIALDGASLFDNRCRLCHQDTSAFQQIDRHRIESVLSSEQINEHRFALSDKEIDALLGYLTDEQQ